MVKECKSLAKFRNILGQARDVPKQLKLFLPEGLWLSIPTLLCARLASYHLYSIVYHFLLNLSHFPSTNCAYDAILLNELACSKR